jgi:iron complex transport system substrate-binding protein
MKGKGQKKNPQIHQSPKRVVSLVPSMTESMFDLGLGDYVVGITDYCRYPQGKLNHLARVGGPKDARLEDILALAPDLVIGNPEENPQDVIEKLETVGVRVWLNFPKTVKQSQQVLWRLLEIFPHKTGIASLQTLELTLDWIVSSSDEKNSLTYFCPIWFEESEQSFSWWMTFNHDTYCEDLLNLFGCMNVFSHRTRRYPLEADLGLSSPEETQLQDTRYPRVTLHEILDSQPQLILLPDEPFPFNEEHREKYARIFAETPAGRDNKIILLDGSLITWYGTRLAYALKELPTLLDSFR